jgi:electron transport complex protein RnfA
MIAFLAALAILSSLSLNLMLQCGLCLRLAAVAREGEEYPVFLQAVLLFLSSFILWLIFFYIVSPLGSGIFTYIFIFPVSVLVYSGLEFVCLRFFFRKNPPFTASVFCDALAGASLFVTLNVASGFVDAVVLCAGFALGVLLSRFILSEIRRRSALEAVPRFLRGSPLILISMGLLSLIFSSAAAVLYRVIGA